MEHNFKGAVLIEDNLIEFVEELQVFEIAVNDYKFYSDPESCLSGAYLAVKRIEKDLFYASRIDIVVDYTNESGYSDSVNTIAGIGNRHTLRNIASPDKYNWKSCNPADFQAVLKNFESHFRHLPFTLRDANIKRIVETIRNHKFISKSKKR